MTINRLSIKNFMSFKKCDLRFPEKGIFSVCGNNGVGKSTLLEVIPFVLYGVTRTSTKKLVKHNEDNMECTLYITVHNKPYIFTRGIRSSDKTYIFIRENGKTIMEGKTAQTYIDSLLGVDSNLFMLTSFFGAGSTDSLINVTVSKRLDTLERIANVNVFNTYHKQTVEIRKKYLEECKALDIKINILKSDMPNLDEIEQEVIETESAIINADVGMSELSELRENILLDIDRNGALLSEEGKLKESIKNLKYELSAVLDETNQNNSTLQSYKDKLNMLCKEREDLNNKLSRFLPESNLNTELEKSKELWARYNTLLTLYESGLKAAKDLCPLCSNTITGDTKKLWEREYSELQSVTVSETNNNKRLRDSLIRIKSFNNSLNSVNAEITKLTERVLYFNVTISDANKYIDEQRCTIAAHSKRISKICTLLAESNNIQERLNDVDAKIAVKRTLEADLKNKVRDLHAKLKYRSHKIKEIGKYEHELTKLTSLCADGKILSGAFSRYGIPYDLIKDLMQRISHDATILYNRFSSGSIELIDVESRGNPGIEYILNDVHGQKEYSVLSTGQRIMVSVCIRLAVAFILREATNINTQVLVLDEIAGNLSPDVCDSLVIDVIDFLKNYFTQIFMVSHAPLLDIFTKSYNLYLEGADSVIKKDI